MALKENGLFVQGEILGVKTFGDVHAEIAVHTGEGNVVKVAAFGSKKDGKCHPALVEVQKLGDRASVCLKLDYMPARDGRESGFALVKLVPLGQ